ncbi:MAG: peroxiredoxin, partial [Armatimonadetes bacterium]|nr:peroxiredoxin [Armatimonadota bacterium]
MAALSISAASALEVGDVAPPVRLLDQTGTLRDVSASYGRWAVLTFYPVDGTAGCTKEALNITANLDKLVAESVDVYGVSTQDVASKQAFCAAQGLKHTLLADTDKSVSTAYGTLIADRGISNRVTFYIDPTRTVRLIDRAVQVATHGEDILKTVATLAAEDAKTPLPKLGETATFGGLSWHLPANWTRRLVEGAVVMAGPDGATLTLSSSTGDATKPGALPDGAT